MSARQRYSEMTIDELDNEIRAWLRVMNAIGSASAACEGARTLFCEAEAWRARRRLAAEAQKP
jgi:hypothetical protein